MFQKSIKIQRSANELTSFQQKIYEIDDHVGVSICGLMADAQILMYSLCVMCDVSKYDYINTLWFSRFMQNKALEHQWGHEEGIPISILMAHLEDSIFFSLYILYVKHSLI